MELETNWLRNNCQTIHYFGLGFIQVKITQYTRLHFYTKKYPILVEEPHNHRYNFDSTILKGALGNNIYGLTNGDTHILSKESCMPGVCLEGKDLVCGLEEGESTIYIKSDHYHLNHSEFHTVHCLDGTITLLNRSDYKKDFAEVIRLFGYPKICPFSLKIPENELWDVVDQMT